MVDLVLDLFVNPFAYRQRPVTDRGVVETTRRRQQLSQNGGGLTIRKLGCQFGLEMEQFRTDAL